jgi:uncharacterized protein (DUF433 family)
MSLGLTTLAIPLRLDADGVARIGVTRVTLDTVVGAFNEGSEADEIARHHPSHPLADVYATIAYYLANRVAVDVYLAERCAEGKTLREASETRWDPSGVRERLEKRRPTVA